MSDSSLGFFVEFRSGFYLQSLEADHSGPFDTAKRFESRADAEAFCKANEWIYLNGGAVVCGRERKSYAPRVVAEAFSLYLNSGAAMALFSKLLLYRASGDNARVVVKCAGKNYRVSIHRTNGEVEHFNRDGKE